jgi:hypothetical protein
MQIPVFAVLAAAGGVAALLALLLLVRRIDRRNRTEPDTPALWTGRDYPCPHCGARMQQGWVLLGKGAIWSGRGQGRPGAFSHIGAALDNTISLSMRPGANMAWRCEDCRLLLLDHDKLVR